MVPERDAARAVVRSIAGVGDVLLAPLTALSASWLKLIRRVGLHRMPASRTILLGIGLLPVRNHYYEPLFDMRALRHPLDDPRDLPGIDWNVDEQLAILDRFDFAAELLAFPTVKPAEPQVFHYGNEAFKSGDAEYLYGMIRLFRPRRIVEIGSGHSTLMARNAIRRNEGDDPAYACDHVCIEPYEQPWLEDLGVTVVRKPVEQVERSIFRSLTAGDILFIDSSHMIRPQGDVLVEFLEILPGLAPGVLVHVHDIFSPRDYPATWLRDEIRLWNEQYLLEAFLSFNSGFRIIGALNFLKHAHGDRLAAACPVFAREFADREPGSFWMIRN